MDSNVRIVEQEADLVFLLEDYARSGALQEDKEFLAMCKQCKASDLGKERQAELAAALEACKAVNINPGTAGFIVRYARTRYVPRDEHPEAQAAVERYNTALAAMKELHNDYVFSIARQAAEAARAKREAQEDEETEHYISRIYLGGE